MSKLFNTYNFLSSRAPVTGRAHFSLYLGGKLCLNIYIYYLSQEENLSKISYYSSFSLKSESAEFDVTVNCTQGPFKQYMGRSINTGNLTIVLYEDPPDCVPKIHIRSRKYMAWIAENNLPTHMHVSKVGCSGRFSRLRN